ncbi:MAG: segregation/condensation protein A, partial [Thermodesulfobacteriota bacterium]|nr:segregation/condensation protein A [Thermodesulfobacteriota bacterium]
GEEEEEEDPRAELMEHLLEYQHYKEVAFQLKSRELLEKDIFTRIQTEEQVGGDDSNDGIIEVSLFELVDALRKVIEKKDLPGNLVEVDIERISVKDKMSEIVMFLKEKQEIIFQAVFDALTTKFDIIVTFLAVLEFMKMRAIKVFQVQPHGEIRIVALRTDLSLEDVSY